MHANYVCKTKVHWDDAIPISDTDWSVKVDFIYWYGMERNDTDALDEFVAKI